MRYQSSWLSRFTACMALGAGSTLMLGAPTVSAADFGGDCCADLEERVAELEATTARKGNRKVSLQIYGQVTSGVMFWDFENSGGVTEDNVYVVDPQTSGTRFGFKGKAKITPDYSAGYHLEFQYQSADATQVTTNSDESVADNILEFRQAHWFIQSQTYGKIRVGLADTANSGIAEINLSKANIADGMSSSQAGTAILGDAFGDGDPATAGNDGVSLGSNFEFNRLNVVRYDSPVFGGFIMSAAYGEDDIWDVALRYAGEIGTFKIAGGIAYGENSDGSSVFGQVNDPRQEVVNGTLSIMETTTGLYATGSAGQRTSDGFTDDESFWFVNSGIEQKFIPFGKTTIFGMVGEYQDRDNDSAYYYGAGLVQQIDSAAMELFISYRHYDLEDGGVGGLGGDLNEADFDVVVSGARIKF
ncbi:MAG: hypothetical protein AAFV45_14110 [Pseudomonadota bacterium]